MGEPQWWVFFGELGDSYVVDVEPKEPLAGPFPTREAAEVWLDAFESGAYL